MKPLASAADAVRPAVARRSVLGSELQRAEATEAVGDHGACGVNERRQGHGRLNPLHVERWQHALPNKPQ